VPDNVVLLTNLSEEGTLGRQLFDMWNNQQREDDRWQNGRLGRNIMLDGAVNLHVSTYALLFESCYTHVSQMKSKIPLQGAELENHLRNVRAAKEKEAAEEAAMALTQRMLEADEDESETDDSEDEDMVERSLHDTMDTSGDGDQNVFVFAEPGAGRSRRRGRANTDMNDWAMETEDGNTKQIISYDIYLKGNVAKTSSFFKSENAQTQRFRMFPYIERKRRVDSYGEVIDVGMWLRRGKALEEDAESAESKESKRIKELEEEKKVKF
jgi:cleavage and polyadenylation specificity factor subunit 2